LSAIVAAVGQQLTPDTQTWVKRATAFSRAAGPDAQTVHFEGSCGLGHTWLRTSPTEVAQPLRLGRNWISADVRLDDRQGLVSRLQARRADTSEADADAVLVLHAYEVWGEGCLQHLEGDFAVVLWDGSRDRLICARDQLGVKPLHYARIPGGLLVATCIEALLMHPSVPDRLDEAVLADFVLSGCYEDFEGTAFVNVKRVPPGHVLTWAGQSIGLRRYWSLPPLQPLVRFGHPHEYVDRFRDLLDQAVADRVTTDRVTVQLSGGLDSTNIAASARLVLEARGVPPDALRAITAVLGGASGDREGDFAAQAAQALGLEFDLLDGSSALLQDPAATPLLVTPEPTPYRPTTFEHDLARLPALHSPVALAGIGGDALLWFGPWYWLEWLGGGHVMRLIRAFIDNERQFGNRLHPAIRTGLRRLRSPTAGVPRPLPDWLDAGLVARQDLTERRQQEPRSRDLDARSLAGSPIWSTLCTWGDASFTRQPVQFRYPMFDLRLLRFCLALPPEPWLVDKRILREASAGRLPPSIRVRPKAPLVDSPAPGHTRAAFAALSPFVRGVPGLDEFVDVNRLARALAELAAGEAEPGRALRHNFGPVLGLAHWLAHRSRPADQSFVAAQPAAV
jgi:asparagine synthase (glutamine-hydrolysing)